ncbi:hypothetical protein [Thalassomonas sp. RHCl1]|uniref:hypothetical protein n=1 Tax=Thalassomonas sp. RHCl1 TaxID=2995320 RepID=UPI00248B4875|nr:hypothetical protein [Thalassomonas sp. RHCl1]
MESLAYNEFIPEKAQVELSGCLLARLIISGVLHCDECKCLDKNAKQVLWQSLLNCSLMEADG